VAGDPKNRAVVDDLQGRMLTRFRETHPEVASLPVGTPATDQLDFFLRPRDSSYSGAGVLDVKYNIK